MPPAIFDLPTFPERLAAFDRATPEERLAAFEALAPALPDGVYWRLLATLWMHGGEWCGRYYHRLFLGYFNSPRGSRHRLMTKAEREARRKLPERVTVYRGYGGLEVPDGISWTLDPETAASFAHDFAEAFPGEGPARIVKGVCNRWDTICYLDGRGEREVVIDPAHVEVLADCPTVKAA